MAWNAYGRAVQALEEGELVACVPIINDAGEKTLAVAGYEVDFAHAFEDPDVLALFLIVDARQHLLARGVNVA